MRRFQSKPKSRIPSTVELTIERLSHDGRGIGHVDGRVVMVDNALPGEVIEAGIDQGNTRLWQGHVRRYLSVSEQRQEPVCHLYGQCGGCQLQHLSATDQLALKQQAVQDHFHRNRLPAIGFTDPLVSAPVGYRHRARFHLSKSGTLGFHGARGRQVIPVEQCPVITTELQALLDRVRREAPLKGLQQLELTVDDAGKAGARAVKASDSARQAFEQWQNAQDWLTEELTYQAGTQVVTARPGDFTQVNREINQQMLKQIRQWLQPREDDRLLDLFCGNGNISLAMLDEVAAILGLESSGPAIEAAKAAVKHHPKAQFLEADLFTSCLQVRPQVAEFAPTIAVLDPPRAGAEQVVQWLSELPSLTRLVYVSCDPATLARDLAQLTADHWHLRKAGLIDMFPQTRHIETMVLLKKNK
ncbi:class I SAM-dependent RNA methyltransferase [Reinekea blandensis]|uniref:23S rRNA (Uracil-5-)-methyltransferase n=1 Tax=Reinekea blandensis MED297 TaxID=314283 RepID=A4BBK4_9GAMM|nr:TRAM domain-containing protein [Reinekea blandensis]EAR10339.1 23S rRNA (uracil-5-)-methyltransferase [Reinekea sp. MED297] [Reinekea blandensis MED297]